MKRSNNKKIILLTGTSSSGKSSISNYFHGKGYVSFHIDDYNGDKRVDQKMNELYKNIENTYGENHRLQEMEYKIAIQYMVNDAMKRKYYF